MKEKVALKSSPADAGYTRLHITPFDSELLKVIVPAAVLPNARHISYHSIQTFPDKRYGFVDLPTADAVKIKNKLNGATLRGAKIHIEPARPENMPKPIPDAIVAPDATSKSKKSKSDKKDKKRKRDNQEIAGVELEDGRKVKRGWTVTPEEAQAKKKKAKDDERKHAKSSEKKDDKKKKRKRPEPESQYTDGPEALVKTRLPPNKVDESTGKDKKKSKKNKNREVLVHEFENNTKFATFLKTTQPTPATGREGASFVEGKGWVKEDGSVLEEVKITRPRTVPKLQVDSMKPLPRTAEDDDDTSSSSGSSSEEDDSSEAPDTMTPERRSSFSNATNIHSGIESDAAARPKSAGSMRSLTIQIPATPTPATHKVHPLEALYKRQKPDDADGDGTKAVPADSEELFTFGSGLGDDLDDDENQGAAAPANDDSSFQGSQLPMTPYSKQDFEWRNTRSAAPTPDTAHPSRISRIQWPMGGEDDILENVQEDGEDDMAVDSVEVEVGQDGEEVIDKYQDFQKWFWKNRGQLDRAWRERRRMARKEKRHRDNKAKEDRAI